MIVSKLILVFAGEREIHLEHNDHLSGRLFFKRATVEFTFTRNFGYVSEAAFPVEENSSLYIPTLPKLIAIDIVLMNI